MFLLVNGIFRETSFTNFVLLAEHCEEVFDQLSNYVRDGLILQSVELINGSHRAQLPIDIFDGKSFSGPMLALKEEVGRLLSEKAQRQNDEQQTIDWNYLLLAHYDRQINAISRLINRLEEAVQGTALCCDAALKQHLVAQYEHVLSHQTSELARFRASHEQVTDRLKRLEA